jgi:dTDP-4-amino-4,6-dideoxygalactose transaminase
VRGDVEHVYYVYPLLFDEAAWGAPRAKVLAAINAEGVPISGGYVKPLYLSPLYQERRATAFRSYSGDARYEEGICPAVERLHNQTMVLLAIVRPPATESDMDDVACAIQKVWRCRGELV